ncbi:unnamed protein product [Caenorhabditis brenneri]
MKAEPDAPRRQYPLGSGFPIVMKSQFDHMEILDEINGQFVAPPRFVTVTIHNIVESGLQAEVAKRMPMMTCSVSE